MTNQKRSELTVLKEDFDYTTLTGTSPEESTAALFGGGVTTLTVTLDADQLIVTLPKALSKGQVEKLINRASGMRGRRQYQEAELLLRLLHSARPDDPLVNHRLGYYLCKPHPSLAAIPYLRQSLHGCTEAQRVLSAACLAILHLIEGDEDEARAVLTRVRFPQLLSKMRRGRDQNFANLVQSVSGILALGGTVSPMSEGHPYPIAHVNLARLLCIAGDTDGAEDCVARVLRLPTDRYDLTYRDLAFAAYDDAWWYEQGDTAVVSEAVAGLLLLRSASPQLGRMAA